MGDRGKNSSSTLSPDTYHPSPKGKEMNDHTVLKVIVRLLLPFILMYAFYVQFHGEASPGGGFQAGIIFASGFIVYSLVYDIELLKRIMPLMAVRVISALGILLYAGTGIVSIAKGGNFLDYSFLRLDNLQGQELGIMLIEIGVGMTVFSVIMLIFYSFGERPGNDA